MNWTEEDIVISNRVIKTLWRLQIASHEDTCLWGDFWMQTDPESHNRAIIDMFNLPLQVLNMSGLSDWEIEYNMIVTLHNLCLASDEQYDEANYWQLDVDYIIARARDGA